MLYTYGMFSHGIAEFNHDSRLGFFHPVGAPRRIWLSGNNRCRQSMDAICQLRILLD